MAEMDPVQSAAGTAAEEIFSGQQLALQAMLLVCALLGFAATTRYVQKRRSGAVNEELEQLDSASAGSPANKSKGVVPKATKTNNKAKSKAKAAKPAMMPTREPAQEPAAEEPSAASADVAVAAAPVVAAVETASVEADEGWQTQKKAGNSRNKVREAEKEAPAPAAPTVAPEASPVADAAEPHAEPAASDATPAALVPLLHCPGGNFNSSHFVDLASNGDFTGTFGGAISISFTARWDALNSWSRIVDFGSGAQKDNVIIANFEQRNTLVADVYRGAARKRLLVQDVITVGEVHKYLFTVSSVGCMRLYMDGTVIGELSKGYAPKDVERSHLYVGKPSSAGDGMFQGCIVDVKLWSEVVDWDVAFAEQPTAPPPQAQSVLPSTATTDESAAPPTTAEKAMPDDEVSERVAKLMAKKAERKARKARERQEKEADGGAEQGAAEDDDRVEEEGEAAACASATVVSSTEPDQAVAPEEAPAQKPEAAPEKKGGAEEAKEAAEAEAAREAAAREAAERERGEREAALRKVAEEEAAARQEAGKVQADEPAPAVAAEQDEDRRPAALRPARGKAAGSKSKEARKKAAAREIAQPQEEEAPPSTIAAEPLEARNEATASETVADTTASVTGEAGTSQIPASFMEEEGFEVAATSRQRRKEKRAAEAEQKRQQQVTSSHTPSQPSQASGQTPNGHDSQARTQAADASSQQLPVDQPAAEAPQVASAQVSRVEVPEAPGVSAGPEGATRTTAPPRTQLERDILKHEKKLREVERLRVRQEAGEALEPNQLEKLAKIDAVREKLAELQMQQSAVEAEKNNQEGDFQAAATVPAQQVIEPVAIDAGQRTSLRQWAMQASRSAAPFVAGQHSGKGKQNDMQDMWMEPMDNLPYAQVCSPGPICIGGKGEIRTPLVAPGPGFMEIGHKDFEEGGMPLPFGHMMSFKGREPEPEFDPTGPPQPAMFLGGPDMASLELQMPPSQAEERWESCWEWVRTGWCPRGITCRWEHPALGPVAFGGGAQFMGFEDEGALPPGVVLAPPGAMMGPAGTFITPHSQAGNLTPPAGLQTGMLQPGGMTMGVLPPGGLPPGPIPDGVMTFSEELQNHCYDILGEDVEASGIVTPQ
mmetsp:Transcript_78809/g.149788  ORF Transcript_78809/g.149788 Transcript_78809/m.149788 type:complete len:1113 (-) Transcript_78809:129-3467(-)